MICAYCGEDKKASKEHIISCSVLDLFPECFITIDEKRKKAYASDPIIKDVCETCNNSRISYIDTYAKELISKYFIKKYKKDDKLDFVYNYTLVQKMLLKYVFNDLRSRKDDISFFTHEIIDFLIDKNKNMPLRNITILAGLVVNTSPVPNYMFGNRKIRWGKNPVFLENSIVEHFDWETGEIRLREKNEKQEFKRMDFSYLFRFNSVQFLMICWKSKISESDLINNNTILNIQYPYTILSDKGNDVLFRCTSESTYHNEMLIDVDWGQGIFDDITFCHGKYLAKQQEYLDKIERLWEKEEKALAEAHPRVK